MCENLVRARYTERTVRVYQAYRPEIAVPALSAGRFVSPFKVSRMTWIKPSFNWMMYRSCYGTKLGQEVVLGIDIRREGFDWALENAALTRFTPTVHSVRDSWLRLLAEKPVRVQWDPERDAYLNVVNGVRTIQIGLAPEAVNLYVHDWIVRIEDVTDTARRIRDNISSGIKLLNLPSDLEVVYPVTSDVRRNLSIG